MKIIIAMIFMCVLAFILGAMLTAAWYENRYYKPKQKDDIVKIKSLVLKNCYFYSEDSTTIFFDDDLVLEDYNIRQKGYRTPNP